jgi:hypothetical protein
MAINKAEKDKRPTKGPERVEEFLASRLQYVKPSWWSPNAFRELRSTLMGICAPRCNTVKRETLLREKLASCRIQSVQKDVVARLSLSKLEDLLI